VLLVVSGTEVSGDGGDGWVASGGQRAVVEPWVPGDEELEAVGYRCRMNPVLEERR
jgi:hypothetical protein